MNYILDTYNFNKKYPYYKYNKEFIKSKLKENSLIKENYFKDKEITNFNLIWFNEIIGKNRSIKKGQYKRIKKLIRVDKDLILSYISDLNLNNFIKIEIII